jgi:hypothetical protein
MVAWKSICLLLCFVATMTPSLLYAESLLEAFQKVADPIVLAPAPAQLATTPHPANLPLEETKKVKDRRFLNLVDRKVYEAAVAKRDEKKILREGWREWLGIDIYFPYFKAKEVEDKVCDKFKVKIFKLHGRPKFEDNQFKYTFTSKF